MRRWRGVGCVKPLGHDLGQGHFPLPPAPGPPAFPELVSFCEKGLQDTGTVIYLFQNLAAGGEGQPTYSVKQGGGSVVIKGELGAPVQVWPPGSSEAHLKNCMATGGRGVGGGGGAGVWESTGHGRKGRKAKCPELPLGPPG